MDRPSIWEAIFDRDAIRSGDKKRRKKFFTRQFSGSITQRLQKVLSSRFFLNNYLVFYPILLKVLDDIFMYLFLIFDTLLFLILYYI